MGLHIVPLGNLFMSINKLKLTAICAVGLLCTNLAYAERSGFYTIIGPDGRVMVIDRSSSERKKSDQIKPQPAQPTLPTASNPTNQRAQVSNPITSSAPSGQINNNQITSSQIALEQSAQQPAPQLKSNSLTEKTNPVLQPVPRSSEPQHSPVSPIVNSVKAQPEPSSAQTSTNPVTVIDGERYIDSEYLEQHEFNLEGKKRFYNLPDGIGGTQIIEREKGVDMTAFKYAKVEQPQVVSLAKDYQLLTKDEVVDLIGMHCFSSKQLKKTKLLNKHEPLNLWPRPSFESKFDFVVTEFQQSIHDIKLTSYADSMTTPTFYWPLPIFLDDKGCVLEGVNSFYQHTILPTVTTHQAIQGYLHIPAGTKYMVLTPLEAAADLKQVQLTNKGQVRLTPIR